MAYKSQKETSNPFLPMMQEKWKELLAFEGDSTIEKIVKCFSVLIVLVIFILFIPIGFIICIRNSIYNLQRKVYNSLSYKSESYHIKVAYSLEFTVYILLSIPFLLLLVPYWVLSVIFTWFAKNEVIALIIITLTVGYLLYQDEIHKYVNNQITYILKQQKI